jgi:hypothetical protein
MNLDSDAGESYESKLEAASSKEGNVGGGNWVAGVHPVFSLEMATSYIETQ